MSETKHEEIPKDIFADLPKANVVDQHQKIKELIAKMILKNVFWGHIFTLIRRVSDTSLPSVMGVAPEKNGAVSLYFHPDLVAATDDDVLMKVMEHEGMHLLNKHISRYIRMTTDIHDRRQLMACQYIWNLAADCAANQQMGMPDTILIAGQPANLCLPKKFKLPDNKHSEFYFESLMKRQDEFVKFVDAPCECSNCGGTGEEPGDGKGEEGEEGEDGQGGGGEGEGEGKQPCSQCGGSGQGGQGEKAQGTGAGGDPLDDHDKWDENLEGVEDRHALSRKIESYTSNIVRQSVKQFNKSRGRLPGHVQDLIDNLLEPPKAPYYQIVKQLVKRAKHLAKYRRCPTRINKKRAFTFVLEEELGLPAISPFPGKKRDYSFNVSILLDTSGSMSPDEIKEGLSGVKDLLENDRHCKIHVVECDTIVHKCYEVKRIADIDFEVKGRGGTAMAPGLAKCKELGTDITLCFTDGYIENVRELPKADLPHRIVWVVSSQYGKHSTSAMEGTGVIVKVDI